jgi:hypothetical protein
MRPHRHDAKQGTPATAKIASAPLPEMITNAMMILAITARYCGLRSA